MRLRLVAFGLGLALAGCGGSPPAPPVVYKPLDYSYLPAITLKVANINLQDDYVPDPGASVLIGQAPEPPATALSDMLNRRLVANGTPGNANVTIQTASIEETGGNLVGVMTVRVDVASGDNRRTAYIVVNVSHSVTAPDPDAAPPVMQAALYDMTRQLMDAMNVKLQYEMQQNLGAWLAYAPNAAAAPLNAGATPLNAGGTDSGGILATPLPTPGAPASMMPAPPPVIAPANALPPGVLPLGTLPAGVSQ